MKKLTYRDAVLPVFGMAFGAAGCVYLETIGRLPLGSKWIERIGFVGALYACLWVILLSWSMLFGILAQKRGWSAKSSFHAGLPFSLIGGVLVWAFLGEHIGFFGVIVATHGLFAPEIVRCMAVPDVTKEQLSQPPPRTNLPLGSFQRR